MPTQPVPAPRQRFQSVRPAARPVGRLGAFPVSLAALVTALASVSAPALAMQAADLPAQNAARVEEAYLVGPAKAAELGCAVGWQALVPNAAGQSLALVDCSPFGVLAVNTRNELSLVRADTGDRAWTASAAERIDRILSAEIVSVATSDGGEQRIAVTTDTGFYTLDLKDGSSLLRRNFRHVPSTRPIVVGQALVFGTRSGQAAWFDCGSGFDMRGYTVDGPLGRSPVVAQPVESDGIVVAGSSQGTVVALDASNSTSLWRKELLGGVTAKPAIANGIAFVASEDQYLYAFDLGSGTTLWKYFTQTPLSTSPFAAGGLVLQDIPGEGLVAFTQNPEGQLGGEVRWKKTGLAGRPIGTSQVGGGEAVLLWCSKGRTVTVVDLRNGDVVRTVELPKVEHLEAGTLEDGGLVAWSSDGRILRLSPLSNGSSGR
jgi:WD40 repeat protein